MRSMGKVLCPNDDASVYEQVDNVEGTVIREFRFEEQPVHPRKQCVKENDNGEIRSLRSDVLP